MTDKKQVVQDWLEMKEWQSASGLDIPEQVLAVLAAFANAEDAGSEALSLYGDALTILFSFYRKPAYRHHALLGRVLLKLGTCSEEQFWRPAAAFLNMAPDLGSKAIPLWVETLQLSAEQQRQLETERFHALR